MSCVDIVSTYNKCTLVGNKFQKRPPSKNDVDIYLIKETNNQYDKNAIAVYSLVDNYGEKDFCKLGYIAKKNIEAIETIINTIKIYKIIRSKDKNEDGLYYYYLLY
jgi:hypothetical protein